MTFANSRLQFFENSFRRTGSVENKSDTETVVPRFNKTQFHSRKGTFAEATFFEMIVPWWSNSSLVARGASAAVAVVIWTSDRAHRELKASPRNPKVSNPSIFSNVDSLEVWCFWPAMRREIEYESTYRAIIFWWYSWSIISYLYQIQSIILKLDSYCHEPWSSEKEEGPYKWSWLQRPSCSLGVPW